jgi:hypothetical protein
MADGRSPKSHSMGSRDVGINVGMRMHLSPMRPVRLSFICLFGTFCLASAVPCYLLLCTYQHHLYHPAPILVLIHQ